MLIMQWSDTISTEGVVADEAFMCLAAKINQALECDDVMWCDVMRCDDVMWWCGNPGDGVLRL